MRTKTKWPMGNLSVSLECEINEANQGIILEAGIRAIGQAVQVDKILGGFETVDGKDVRKKDWKRGSVIPTSDQIAEIKKALESACVNKVPMGFEATLSPKGKASKIYKDGFIVVGNHESAGDLEEWAMVKLNYSGPTHEDGEYALALVQAADAYVKAYFAEEERIKREKMKSL